MPRLALITISHAASAKKKKLKSADEGHCLYGFSMNENVNCKLNEKQEVAGKCQMIFQRK